MSNCITGLWRSSVTALIFRDTGALLANAFGLPGPLEDRISRGVGNAPAKSSTAFLDPYVWGIPSSIILWKFMLHESPLSPGFRAAGDVPTSTAGGGWRALAGTLLIRQRREITPWRPALWGATWPPPGNKGLAPSGAGSVASSGLPQVKKPALPKVTAPPGAATSSDWSKLGYKGLDPWPQLKQL